MYHFCEKGKLSMQPLKRPTNASLIRISHTISEERPLDWISLPFQTKIHILCFYSWSSFWNRKQCYL